MRTTANVAQMKAKLSEYLRQVKGGSEVLITERGISVARLVPLEFSERRTTRDERLVRAGIMRAPQGRRKKLGTPQVRGGSGKAVLDALLAERDESH